MFAGSRLLLPTTTYYITLSTEGHNSDLIKKYLHLCSKDERNSMGLEHHE